MKVKELIEKLEKCNPNATVTLSVEEYNDLDLRKVDGEKDSKFVALFGPGD